MRVFCLEEGQRENVKEREFMGFFEFEKRIKGGRHGSMKRGEELQLYILVSIP